MFLGCRRGPNHCLKRVTIDRAVKKPSDREIVQHSRSVGPRQDKAKVRRTVNHSCLKGEWLEFVKKCARKRFFDRSGKLSFS